MGQGGQDRGYQDGISKDALAVFASGSSTGPVAVLLCRGRSHLAALTFSVVRLGQLPDDLDELGALMRRQQRGAMLLQGEFADVGSRRRNNNRGHKLSPFRIG